MKLYSLVVQPCREVGWRKIFRRFSHEVWNSNLSTGNQVFIKSQLEKYNLTFTEGYTCFHVKNCSCLKDVPEKAKLGDLYVNKRTGFFLCEHCKRFGDWTSYDDFLTKVNTQSVSISTFKKYWPRFNEEPPEWLSVKADSEELKNLSDAAYAEVIKQFDIPFCSRKISEVLKIRITEDRSQLIFPLQVSKYSVAGYKAYNKDGSEITFPKTNCPGFLQYSEFAQSVAVIVTNIRDFITLVSHVGIDYDIICLQYGIQYLPPISLPFLENYEKIILWLSEGNLDSIGSVARKLNEKRCYVVRPSKTQTSASTAAMMKRNISEILSKAKLTWHQYVITFGSLREDILMEMQDKNVAVGVPWKKFPALTKLLKGHRRGELTILTGPTGSGKTTFLSEYSLDLAMQGVNTLWGSFEIKNTRLAKILLTQFAEGPLPEDVNEYSALCDKFEELPIFFLTFHGQQDLQNVMETVQHCSYTYDIAHVIIDNVQFMIEVAPDNSRLDRFWKQDYMIQSFRNFASVFNCHVTLVMHPKKIEGMDLGVNSIFGGAKASQEADNVLILQKKDLNSFGIRKYMEVSKNRYSGDLGLFPLYFDKSSLSFSKKRKCSEAPMSELPFEEEPQQQEEVYEEEAGFWQEKVFR